MCLGVPGRVVSVHDQIALVDFWGARRETRLDVIDEPVQPGDYILNHVGFAIRRIDDATGADAFFDALSLLHGRRWSEAAGEDGVLAPDAVQHFHRAALPGLIEAGLARLFELRIGGRMAGCYYGFFDRGRAYAYIGGFDSEFAAASPGRSDACSGRGREARRNGSR